MNVRGALVGGLLAIAVAHVTAPSVQAQSQQGLLAQYTIASWTDRDHLPSARIWAIEQDVSGYLWIGTDAGVFRFDGVRFAPIETLARPAVPAERANALLTSRDGGVWVALDTGEIGRLKDGQLSRYGEREGLPRGSIFAFCEDHAGTLWAGTSEGLYGLHGERWERLGDEHGLPRAPILTVFEDHRHQLWAATRATVLRRAAGRDTFEPVGLVAKAGFLNPRFSEDAGGGIWITDRGQGFRRIDALAPTVRPAVRGTGVYLLHDRTGNLWVATQGQGLWRARPDATGREMTVDTITARDGLLSDAVRAIHEDREGNIWVGTYSGLQRLTPRRVAALTEFGIARTLGVTPDGSVWIATASGLVRRSKRGVQTYSERDGLPGPTVLSLHTDEQGVLWIGTDRGVARFIDNRFVPLRLESDVELSRPMTIVGHRTTWVRDTDFGWFHVVNGMLKPLALFSTLGRSVSLAHVDGRGRTWLGFTTTPGLGVMEPGADHVRSIDLPIGRVSTMYETSDGDVWVGGSTGASRISGDHIASIGQHNGLPGRIFAMVDDTDGVLWMATSAGIVRLTKDEFDKGSTDPTYQVRYRLFDPSDGSAGVPTSAGGLVAVRDDTGRLWFATSSGVTIVDPRRIGEPRPVAPVRIETAAADARSLDPIADARLPARTSHLQIDYTSLVLTDPERVRFRYRLDGLDNNWIDAGTSRQATYTNLRPGNYRFRVVATSNDHDGNEQGAAWRFTVLPTFYQTRTFYAAGMALAGLMIWGAWRVRVRQVRNHFALVLAERIRMSRAIHDTLLQGLVGLALQFNDLSRTLESSPPARDRLSQIRRQIEEYIREARSSIWDLRSPQLESRDLPTALGEAAERAAAGTPTQLDFTVTGQPRPASASIEGHLLVICQEAVSNAVRHGHPQHVHVELRYEHDAIRLRVTDDGCGFDVDVARRTQGHYGLISMRERVEQVRGSLNIVSGPHRGTEVDAVVPTSA